jgi:hypothetical protein
MEKSDKPLLELALAAALNSTIQRVYNRQRHTEDVEHIAVDQSAPAVVTVELTSTTQCDQPLVVHNRRDRNPHHPTESHAGW